jgi:methionine-rich copper-binding protein CopC
MRQITLGLLLPALLLGAPGVPAQAHAFLDHANPAVGATVRTPLAAITLWFSQELEPAFSTVSVVDRAGDHVNRGDAQVDTTDRKVLRVALKPLGPGLYKATWRVVSVDTHSTEGDFTFRVAAP